MRQIAAADFKEMPWANGGGTTHEIARSEVAGTLRWRFSLAEVRKKSRFSTFKGLGRVLTVIEGRGLTLTSPDFTIKALPFVPVAFPGEAEVEARLIKGRVRDLNLFFDPVRFVARGAVLTGPGRYEGAEEATFLWLAPDSADVGALCPGDAAVLGADEPFTLPEGARVVALGLDLPV
jgi:environmental stress-induced protein Ves